MSAGILPVFAGLDLRAAGWLPVPAREFWVRHPVNKRTLLAAAAVAAAGIVIRVSYIVRELIAVFVAVGFVFVALVLIGGISVLACVVAKGAIVGVRALAPHCDHAPLEMIGLSRWPDSPGYWQRWTHGLPGAPFTERFVM